jgi:hypothetical protein
LVQYLQSFEGAPPAALAEAREPAARAVRHALGSAARAARSSLPSLAAVRALGAFAESAPYVELLAVFATQRVAAFDAFAATHGDWLAAAGLAADQCRASMRVLTLCSLAASANDIPYAAVAAELQVRGGTAKGGGRGEGPLGREG